MIGDPSVSIISEDDASENNQLITHGIITVSDVDQGQSSLLTAVASAENNLGELHLEPNGQYTYTVDNNLTGVKQLGTGDLHTDYFTISALDGTTKVVQFTVRGTQDVAVIGTPSNASVTEDGAINFGKLTAIGTIQIIDPDVGQSGFLTTVIAESNNLGQFVIDTQGNYIYTVDNSLQAIQQLGASDTHVDRFTVTSLDGTTKIEEFTIHGAQDTATIGDPTVASVAEDTNVIESNLSAEGIISISDTDQGQAYFLTEFSAAQNNLGTLQLESNGHYLYKVNNGLVAVQQLDENQSHVDYFAVTAADGTTKVVSFTIHGANDPIASIAITGVAQDSGVIGDYLTNSTSLTILGTNGLLRSDQRIQISSDAINWHDVSGVDGTWTYLDSTLRSDGVVDYRIRIIDMAGNISNVANHEVTIDTLAPEIFFNTPISTDGYLNGVEANSSLTISGTVTGAEGQIATVHLGIKDYTATVTGGAFSVAVSSADLKALSEGTVNITANVSDAAGNAAPQATASYLFDKTAPTIALNTPISSDGYLNGVEANSSLTISGTVTGAEGQIATIHLGTKDYTATVTGGAFSVAITSADLKALSEGTVNITANVSDAAGNAATQATASYLYDKTAPTIALNTPISSDGYLNGIEANSSLTISGTATGAEGQIATIHLGTKDYTATVTGGAFSVAVSSADLKALSEGTVNITANVSDAAGNAAAQATASYLYDKTAPTISLNTPISSDGYLNGIEANSSLTISGTATGAEGQIATIHLGTKDYTATVTGGAFSVAVSSADLKALSEGTVNITANVSDAAGNAATQATASYLYDKTAPTISLNTPISSDGYLNGIEANSSLTISGTATGAEGQIATVHLGTKDYTATVTGGAFSVAVSSADLKALSEGTVNITANVSDAAGNAAPQATASYLYDKTAPTISLNTPISSDGYLNGVEANSSLTISGTATGAEGQIATIHLGTKDYTATVASGAFSVAVSSADLKALSEGTVNITANVSDAAGNAAAQATASYLFDKTAPTIALNTPISSDGYLNGIESNSSLTISGTATGAEGQIATVHLGTKDYTATVTGGAFSVAVSSADLKALSEGTVNITANVSDAAGNAAAQATASYLYDKTAPTISLNTPISSDGYLNGVEANSSLTISGTATGAEGQIATIHLGTKDYTATVTGGAFSVAVSSADLKALSEGTVNITANVSDAAGNAAAQATANYLYDKTAPTIALNTPISSDGYLNSIESNSSLTISGTATGAEGQIATVHLGTKDYMATVTGGAFSVAVSSADLKALSEGTVNITANVSDAAGNAATQATASYLYDKTAPTVLATLSTLSSDTGITGDFVTNIATQTLSGTYTGTLGSGEKIQVSADSLTWIDTTANAGVWSTASNAVTLTGTGTYSVRSIDTAGNTTAGTGHSYILDIGAPILSSVSATQTTLDQAVGTTATLTFRFNEAVYGLTTTDFSALSYGTLTNLTQVSGTPSQWTALYTDTKTQNSITSEVINIKTTGTTTGHDLAGNLIATTGNTGITLTVGKSPITLDLNGDGIIDYLDQSAGVTYDYANNGQPIATSWVGPSDGLLAIQKSDHSFTIVFSTQLGETDLQGLAKVYDTNHDNVLSALDTQFKSFGVWQDVSSNGKVESGEFMTLNQAGITSISLLSDNIPSIAAQGEVLINGQSSFTKVDGSTGRVDDVTFSTGAFDGVVTNHGEANPDVSSQTTGSVSTPESKTVLVESNSTITLKDVLQESKVDVIDEPVKAKSSDTTSLTVSVNESNPTLTIADLIQTPAPISITNHAYETPVESTLSSGVTIYTGAIPIIQENLVHPLA